MPAPKAKPSKSLYKRNMSRDGSGRIMLHWQICEGEEEWQAGRNIFSADGVREAHNPRLLFWQRWWPVLLALTFVGVLGGVAWMQAQIGLAKIEAELQATVDGETWLAKQPTGLQRAARQSDSHASEHVVTFHAFEESKEAHAVTSMEFLELKQDWARVQVIEQRANSASIYRQTRVYQFTAAGWHQVPPTSNHWGSARQLESRYFIFNYFAQDAAAVEAAAPRLDALYPVFYAALMPGSLPAEKVQVQIAPTHPDGEKGDRSAHRQPLMIRSPAVMLAPAEMTDDELLLQSVALGIFDHLAARAVEVLDLPAEWFAIRHALLLWLIWDQELPLARWRKPLVQWGFSNAQVADTTQSASAQPVPHALCVSHQLWMISPADFGVPVDCFEHLDVAKEDSRANPSNLPTLQTLAPHMPAVTLATLLEYLSSTYGDDKIRATMGLLSFNQPWASLLSTLYGVSTEEVEAGWRDFLSEHE